MGMHLNDRIQQSEQEATKETKFMKIVGIASKVLAPEMKISKT